MGHYSLDIHPQTLRNAAKFLGDVESHMVSKGKKAKDTRTEIENEWTGEAANTIKPEMTALGGVMTGGDGTFSHGLNEAQQALTTLAGHYDKALEDLGALNTRWTNADTAYAEDKPPAGETDDGSAADTRDRTRGNIDTDFDELKEWCSARTKECGEVLALSSPIAYYGYNGSTPSYSTNTGALLSRLTATDQHLQAVDEERQSGAEAARTVEDVVNGDASQEELLALLDGQSEAFRQGFIDNLDPEALRALHAMSTTGDPSETHGDLITAIGTILAQGSNPETQPNYPPDPSTFVELREVYTSAPEGTPEELAGREEDLGHLLFSELVAAGQGDGATWESGLLADWARDTFQHERDRIAEDEYWSWSDAADTHVFTTDVALDWNWKDGAQTSNSWGDPVVLLNGALGKDPDAANAAYTLDGRADTELLEHMYNRHGNGGPYVQHNLALGEALVAATSHVGPGGPGTQNFVSAEIASHHVDYWANADGDQLRLYDQLDSATIDILTQHVQAVNHAGAYADVDTRAITPYEGGTLPYERIALANLDRDELQKVLQLGLGLDYFSNQISEEEGNGNSFPLYTQLATAMEDAARNDVILAAQSGEAGVLERTVNTLSSNQELANNALRDALIGQGREEDQANADARAGLTFVLDQVSNKIPTDKLGDAQDYAGLGLDQAKELLVDLVIPESDYATQAETDASTEDYRRQLTSLKLVEWLDDAGVLPQEHSPEQWAADHPDAASFVDENGQLPSIQELFQNRNNSPEDQQAWIDFKRYYENDGGAWLAEIDVDEQYQLGWIIEDQGEGGG